MHVYPAQHTPVNVSVLPAAPVSLLRRKIAKQIAVKNIKAVRMWTVRRDGEGREGVTEVSEEDGKDIGWWLGDGDELIVERDVAS